MAMKDTHDKETNDQIYIMMIISKCILFTIMWKTCDI
jgi:hypothetical protein